MKSKSEQLDEMNKTIQIATDRIRYYKQQDKMLQKRVDSKTKFRTNMIYIRCRFEFNKNSTTIRNSAL